MSVCRDWLHLCAHAEKQGCGVYVCVKSGMCLEGEVCVSDCVGRDDVFRERHAISVCV